MQTRKPNGRIPSFNRDFLESRHHISCIGKGQFGGKGSGLVYVQEILEAHFDPAEFPQFDVAVPRMMVISSDVFDAFMQQNELWDIALSEAPDERIAHAFLQGNLPSEIVGDLWALMAEMHTPLAIRSSSLLEDAMYEPFAGVYATKMTPNNQFDTTTRFHKLVEAIKYVYASTYFQGAKAYFRGISNDIREERMALVVQEVVGQRYGDRFYPMISGVARSYNFYPIGKEKPADGVVELALGLGRTIVDEGISWSYSPRYPRANAPYNTINDLMKMTQNHFWAIQMGRVPGYDPVRETEYLLKAELPQAAADKTLQLLASSYDYRSDRLFPGVIEGFPPIVTFAPLLQHNQLALNDLVKHLLQMSQAAVGAPVEMEFALRCFPQEKRAEFGFLQLRPMVVSTEELTIREEEMTGGKVLAASDKALGNGSSTSICDVIYVKPDSFQKEMTTRIGLELDGLNRQLLEKGRHYLLMGFGRWGSTDPWLGIPVDWGQINGTRAIVESTLPEMNIEFSQGTHFFHNLTSFRVPYFFIHHDGNYRIDWDWLDKQEVIQEAKFVKHVRLSSPLRIRVDGRTGRGVIEK